MRWESDKVEDERHDEIGDVVGEGKTGKVNGYGGWRRGVLGGVAR